MRLPAFLRRPEPAPVSPQMQALYTRAKELRWEVIFQRGVSPESRELDDVNAAIAELRLLEAQGGAAAV